MSLEAPAVGIDLGTTYSCISYYQNDVANVIPNEGGRRTTASYVSFGPEGRTIGDDAKNRAVMDTKNTIFGIKYLIGRNFDDPELEETMKIYPYKIISVNGKPRVSIIYDKQNRVFAPEELSAMILSKLKDLASEHFGKKVTKAVITVPAHFNDAQRQATKNAGRIAGLEVLKIINEPTAAALAYGIHKKYRDCEPTILVYDFGGGTFDVSIISLRAGVFEVKATNGISHLGGDDLDVILTDYFAKEFEKQYSFDITKDTKAMRRLRAQCEKVKEMLSLTNETYIDIDYLYQGKDLYCKVTREKLNELCKHIFLKSIKCVEDCLTAAKISKDQIDEILLVGGSTRIPGVKKYLKEYFNKELNAVLNPDEAVAMGAAIEAAILDGEQSNTIKQMLLLDVCPLSLGIQTQGGIMNVIIPRNTQIPVEKTKNYQTTRDNQTHAKIVVYEGEGTLVARNIKLGDFTVKGIEQAPRGEVKFDVCFKVDTNGILDVTATGIQNGIEGNLQVESFKGHLTEEEIKEMIIKADTFRIEDDKKKAVVKAKIDLQRLCNDMQTKADEIELKEKEKKNILDKIGKVLDWLSEPRKRTEQDYLKKKKEVESASKPILKKK